jgi:hypothetical protein
VTLLIDAVVAASHMAEENTADGALSGQDSTTRLAVDQRRLVSEQPREPNVAELGTVICAFSSAAAGGMPSCPLLKMATLPLRRGAVSLDTAGGCKRYVCTPPNESQNRALKRNGFGAKTAVGGH